MHHPIDIVRDVPFDNLIFLITSMEYDRNIQTLNRSIMVDVHDLPTLYPVGYAPNNEDLDIRSSKRLVSSHGVNIIQAKLINFMQTCLFE